MGRSIGVLATRDLCSGIVEDTRLGAVRMYPDPGRQQVDLKTVPVDEILSVVRRQVVELSAEGPIDSVGAGFPGIVRCGLIEESPNLGQLKGLRVAEQLQIALEKDGIRVPV